MYEVPYGAVRIMSNGIYSIQVQKEKKMENYTTAICRSEKMNETTYLTTTCWKKKNAKNTEWPIIQKPQD